MNKIKLPAEFQSGNSVPVERATITRQRMAEILAAAIEADRKRRGEPVAYRVLRKNFDEQWVSDDRYWWDGQPDKDLIEDIQTRSGGWKIEIAYSTPQPQQIPEGYKPTKLNIGVSATAEGAAICIMKPNADGTVTVIYSGTHPLGDSLGCAMLEAATQPTTENP